MTPNFMEFGIFVVLGIITKVTLSLNMGNIVYLIDCLVHIFVIIHLVEIESVLFSVST